MRHRTVPRRHHSLPRRFEEDPRLVRASRRGRGMDLEFECSFEGGSLESHALPD